jgi:hypothetical protein
MTVLQAMGISMPDTITILSTRQLTELTSVADTWAEFKATHSSLLRDLDGLAFFVGLIGISKLNIPPLRTATRSAASSCRCAAPSAL